MWSQRDISVYGKINLVKSLALSKLVFICSVMETPKLFVGEVNKIGINCLPLIVATSPAIIELVTVVALPGANCFCSFPPKPSSLRVLTMTIFFYPFRISHCDDSMSAKCHFKFENHWIVLF